MAYLGYQPLLFEFQEEHLCRPTCNAVKVLGIRFLQLCFIPFVVLYKIIVHETLLDLDLLLLSAFSSPVWHFDQIIKAVLNMTLHCTIQTRGVCLQLLPVLRNILSKEKDEKQEFSVSLYESNTDV